MSQTAIDPGPFYGATTGVCIQDKFHADAHVPPFGGPPVVVGKSFTID